VLLSFIPKQLEDAFFAGDKSVLDKAAVGSFGYSKSTKANAASRAFSPVAEMPFPQQLKTSIFKLFGYIPKIIEDSGRRQLNETGAPARPGA